MAQPLTSDVSIPPVKDPPFEKNSRSTSNVLHRETPASSCLRDEKEHFLRCPWEGQATESPCQLRQRPRQGRQAAQGAQWEEQRVSVWSAAVEKTSATERSRMQTSCRKKTVYHVHHAGIAVRNRKRQWRLLAEQGMLTTSFEGARKRKEDHYLTQVFKPSQRKACFGADEEKASCCLLTDGKISSGSCAGGDVHPCRPLSPVTSTPSSAVASAPVEQPACIIPSPSPRPNSQDCAPSLLPRAALRTHAYSPGVGSSFCHTGGSIAMSTAAVAPHTTSASSCQTAGDASWLLNPPSFAALGVPPALIRVAASLHIERPSLIQILTLPRALQGGDLCGVAPTGTGKTLCYCWPLLQRIACGRGHAFLGLVLLPARELAVQVLEQFRIYGASLGTRVGVLLGGRDLTEEGKMLLHQAPHILIATPGRLADNVQNNSVTMRQRLSVVEVLVLDEADMLLSDDFKEDLKCILGCLPPSSAGAACSSQRVAEIPTGVESANLETSQKTAWTALHEAAPDEKDQEPRTSCSRSPAACSTTLSETQGTAPGNIPRIRRQTLLFSATVSPALLALQQQRFGNALMPLFDATAAATQVCQLTETTGRQPAETGMPDVSTQQQVLLPRLSHFYLFVPTAMRFAYLLYLLEHVPPFNRDRGIIFAGSVRQTQRLCTALEVLQQQATSLHSLMKQRTRIACLEKFRSEVARLLVCTDVAGRGLDLPRVEFVICLDVPSKPQVYVHRTGRTARAGRKGVALTFVDPSGVRAVHRIEAYIQRQLEPLASFNEDEVLQHLNHYSRVLQKAALFLNEIGFDEKAEQHEAYSKAFKELRRRRRDPKPLPV